MQLFSNYLSLYDMNSKKGAIIMQIQSIVDSQNFEWINNYNKPKDELLFKCKCT